MAERDTFRRVRLGQEDPGHRRHEHGGGHPLITDQLGVIRRITLPVVVRDHNRGARGLAKTDSSIRS
jgi:hypothetical protein